MQIHLDPLGGIAGDMFIAAMLDAFPQYEAVVLDALASLGRIFAPELDARVPTARLTRHDDGVLVGKQFEVAQCVRPAVRVVALEHSHRESHAHSHEHAHGEAQSHSHGDVAHPTHLHDECAPGHVAWKHIRQRLTGQLSIGAQRHALGIFQLLAEAEAAVHGVAVEDVEFHEVGAWDSIADIAGAAVLIDALAVSCWTTAAIPLGFGRVRTAHGPLPIPAPATARLLRGFPTIDDRIGGERVTPTGAALLRYLVRLDASESSGVRVMRHSGIGFGHRRLPGISNCLRVLVYDDAASTATASPDTSAHRQLAVLEFEVDDQTPEELAMGLDRLRQESAVYDVIQMPVLGKKCRVMSSVRVLAKSTEIERVVEACFRETTTIGLRHSLVHGAALPRRIDVANVEGHEVRVKTVERPGGRTAKAEADDALAHETQGRRRWLRAEAERTVLERLSKEDHAR